MDLFDLLRAVLIHQHEIFLAHAHCLCYHLYDSASKQCLHEVGHQLSSHSFNFLQQLLESRRRLIGLLAAGGAEIELCQLLIRILLPQLKLQVRYN